VLLPPPLPPLPDNVFAVGKHVPLSSSACHSKPERSKTHGKFGDSFDDILNRLMDIVEVYA
jgi:hypothetical protein